MCYCFNTGVERIPKKGHFPDAGAVYGECCHDAYLFVCFCPSLFRFLFASCLLVFVFVCLFACCCCCAFVGPGPCLQDLDVVFYSKD